MRILILIPSPSPSLHMQMLIVCVLLFCASFSCPSLQVQKNCLLALCSEFILQDVPFDKLVCLPCTHTVNPGSGQDNQCSNGTASSRDPTKIFFPHGKQKPKEIVLSRCNMRRKKHQSDFSTAFFLLLFCSSHGLFFMFQVFSRHAGDKLAEQPRGPDPPEDGSGRHLRSGGQGQDAARALCISALQRKIAGHLSPPAVGSCTSATPTLQSASSVASRSAAKSSACQCENSGICIHINV